MLYQTQEGYAALDFFRIGTVIGSTFVMGTRAEALYEAIEELAEGQGTSISLLNKVEAAVNTSKVALALNSIRIALQVRAVCFAGEMQSVLIGTHPTLWARICSRLSLSNCWGLWQACIMLSFKAISSSARYLFCMAIEAQLGFD
jgi:hypothetical protein